MPTTTSPLGPDFAKDFISFFFSAIEVATKHNLRLTWDMVLIPFLREHWMLVIAGLFVAFVLVSLKAMAGRWGSLGSFLYNFFYFGTLFVVGLIWGPEVFAGDMFKFACTALLYPVCYILSGVVMDKMGVRRHR